MVKKIAELENVSCCMMVQLTSIQFKNNPRNANCTTIPRGAN